MVEQGGLLGVIVDVKGDFSILGDVLYGIVHSHCGLPLSLRLIRLIRLLDLMVIQHRGVGYQVMLVPATRR